MFYLYHILSYLHEPAVKFAANKSRQPGKLLEAEMMSICKKKLDVPAHMDYLRYHVKGLRFNDIRQSSHRSWKFGSVPIGTGRHRLFDLK